MKNRYFIFLLVLLSCTQKKSGKKPGAAAVQSQQFARDNGVHILTDSVKIVIEADTACNKGTKFQYILTPDSFMHVYRKNYLLPQDTIIAACSLPASDTLTRLMKLDFNQISGPPRDNECRLTFTYFRGGGTKTVYINDRKKNRNVAMAIAYLNSVMEGSDKYTIVY